MSKKIGCKIDTIVFEKVEKIVLHFSRSIGDVQRHINQYLKDATEDFNHQLNEVKLRHEEAKKEVLHREKEKEKAKNAWDDAKVAKEKALVAYEEAQDLRAEANKSMNSAFNDKQDAYQEKKEAEEIWREAKKAQQEAYYEMKNHEITHDEFVEYQEDTAEKEEIFIEKNAIFTEKNQIYKSKKEEFEEAKRQEIAAKNAYKEAQNLEKAAKNAYFEAGRLLDEAIKERERRKANLKEARDIVTRFKMYKKDYYHPYYNIIGQNSGCDSLLFVMRTKGRQEFGQALKQIQKSVNDILCCSLKEGVPYVTHYSAPPQSREKTEESKTRIRENLVKNKIYLNRELDRPDDDPPKFTERCKGCGRLISLCNCPDKNAPTSLSEK